jgi:hypothetical protein
MTPRLRSHTSHLVAFQWRSSCIDARRDHVAAHAARRPAARAAEMKAHTVKPRIALLFRGASAITAR